jgi:Domain of unknown function (DUF4399)
MRTIAPICSLLLMFLPALSQAQNATPAPAALPRTASPAGAMEYFIAPQNGAKVTSPFVVRFGLKGMGVAPAGVTNANTGHHHLLIDTDLPPDNLPIPNDDKHRHFGAGQTEVELTLPPGQHTLQLVLGDANHVPHQPPVHSEKITITVR